MTRDTDTESDTSSSVSDYHIPVPPAALMLES